MTEKVKTIMEMLAEEPEKKEEVKVEEVQPEKSEAAEIKVEEPKIEEKAEEVKIETSDEEPAKEEVEEVKPAEKKLYAGKFEKPEDLEKAYSELQSAFTKKSQNVSEKVKETETLLDEREFEQKVASEIENKALGLIEKSFAGITDEESRKKGAEYLMGYKSTGDYRFIEAYYNCLPPTVDRQLQKQLTQVALETRQDFASRRSEIMYEPVKKELMEIEKEDPEFLKVNQDILVQAIKNNPKTSVKEIRELIKVVQNRAVEDYKKSQKSAPKVEKSAITPVQKAPAPKPEDAPKKPFYQMSVKEMLLNE